MLSIIIPSHNEEKYIANCLNSITQQDCAYEYEVIVVNNASTDNTPIIIREFDVKLIDQPKKGLPIAKNTGVVHSKFENILFIDSDCILPQDHVHKVCEVFLQNPELAAFGGPYIYRDGGRLVNIITEDFIYYYHVSNLFNTLFHVPIISGGNFAIRKKVFLELGGFNEKLKSPIEAEDFEFCTRLEKKGYEFHMLANLPVSSSFRRQLRPTVLKDSFTRLSNTFKYLRVK